MPVGTFNTRTTYYSISKNGKVRRKYSENDIQELAQEVAALQKKPQYQTDPDYNEKSNLLAQIQRSKDSSVEFLFIEGYLSNIEIFPDEKFNGDPSPKIRFTFTDKALETREVLQVGLRSRFTRDVLTRLAGLEGFGWIRFTPWINEYTKDDGQKGHVTAGAVRNNGEKIQPFYYSKEYLRHNFADLGLTKDEAKDRFYPPINYENIKGKTIKFPEEQNEFFDDLAKSLAKKCIGAKSIDTPEPGDALEPEEVATVDDDDLPF